MGILQREGDEQPYGLQVVLRDKQNPSNYGRRIREVWLDVRSRDYDPGDRRSDYSDQKEQRMAHPFFCRRTEGQTARSNRHVAEWWYCLNRFCHNGVLRDLKARVWMPLALSPLALGESNMISLSELLLGRCRSTLAD